MGLIPVTALAFETRRRCEGSNNDDLFLLFVAARASFLWLLSCSDAREIWVSTTVSRIGRTTGPHLVTAFCRIALCRGLISWTDVFFRRDEDDFKNDDGYQDHGVCSPPNKTSRKCGNVNRTNAGTTLVSS